MFTIYRIVGPTGKCYIGQTRLPLVVRWRTHVSRAFSSAKNQCKHLANAIRKYGKDSFIIESLSVVDTKERANDLEKLLIQKFNLRDPKVGYNITAGGDGSLGIRGHKLSEEHKKKLSLAKIGHKIHLGRKHTAEARANMSAAHIGYVHTPEQKAKNRASHLGRTYKKRKPASAARREQMRINGLGRTHSAESIAKMKVAAQIREQEKFIKTVAYG
jgi:group I intron endonuclease